MTKKRLEILVTVPAEPIRFLSKSSVPLCVANEIGSDVVVESVEVCFKSDAGKPTARTTFSKTFPDFYVKEHSTDCRDVFFEPNLLFLSGTNIYAFSLRYRRVDQGRPGPVVEQEDEGGFVIVREAEKIFGYVFISYKEPEDRLLADALFVLCEKAGFTPYIAPADLRPGTDIWKEKIPPQIEKSKLVFVIWTKNSDKGPGVRNEIELARKYGVHTVPLIADGTPTPDVFSGGVEWTNFFVRDAVPVFANVVRAARGH